MEDNETEGLGLTHMRETLRDVGKGSAVASLLAIIVEEFTNDRRRLVALRGEVEQLRLLHDGLEKVVLAQKEDFLRGYTELREVVNHNAQAVSDFQDEFLRMREEMKGALPMLEELKANIEAVVDATRKDGPPVAPESPLPPAPPIPPEEEEQVQTIDGRKVVKSWSVWFTSGSPLKENGVWDVTEGMWPNEGGAIVSPTPVEEESERPFSYEERYSRTKEAWARSGSRVLRIYSGFVDKLVAELTEDRSEMRMALSGLRSMLKEREVRIDELTEQLRSMRDSYQGLYKVYDRNLSALASLYGYVGNIENELSEKCAKVKELNDDRVSLSIENQKQQVEITRLRKTLLDLKEATNDMTYEARERSE